MPGLNQNPEAQTLFIDWAQVKASTSYEAERRLAGSEFVLISDEDANRYLAAPLKAGASLKLFLVRGLYLNRDTGHFIVTFDGKDLFVFHGSLDRSAVPMKRQPIIVALPTPPLHVYVTASMAE